MNVRLANTAALVPMTQRQRPRVPSPVAAGGAHISTRPQDGVEAQLLRYRLVDPLDHVVVYEGEDTHEYIDMLRRFPVVEVEEGGEAVTEVYRQGRVPYLEILD